MTVYRSFPYFPTPFNGIYHEISRFLLLKAVLNVVLVSIPLGMMIPRDESCSTEAPEAEDQKPEASPTRMPGLTAAGATVAPLPNRNTWVAGTLSQEPSW